MRQLILTVSVLFVCTLGLEETNSSPGIKWKKVYSEEEVRRVAKDILGYDAFRVEGRGVGGKDYSWYHFRAYSAPFLVKGGVCQRANSWVSAAKNNRSSAPEKMRGKLRVEFLLQAVEFALLGQSSKCEDTLAWVAFDINFISGVAAKRTIEDIAAVLVDVGEKNFCRKHVYIPFKNCKFIKSKLLEYGDLTLRSVQFSGSWRRDRENNIVKASFGKKNDAAFYDIDFRESDWKIVDVNKSYIHI